MDAYTVEIEKNMRKLEKIGLRYGDGSQVGRIRSLPMAPKTIFPRIAKSAY